MLDACTTLVSLSIQKNENNNNNNNCSQVLAFIRTITGTMMIAFEWIPELDENKKTIQNSVEKQQNAEEMNKYLSC